MSYDLFLYMYLFIYFFKVYSFIIIFMTYDPDLNIKNKTHTIFFLYLDA